MITTVDLPDDLVKAIKLRALQDGREWTESMADLLRKALSTPSAKSGSVAASNHTRFTKDPVTVLPLVICRADVTTKNLTTGELFALEQTTQIKEDLERVGLPT